jgi:hypothetical protein
MTKTKFPEGWDDEKVKRVLSHYAEQSEDEAAAEDEASLSDSEAVMSVPQELVPVVREQIAKRRG